MARYPNDVGDVASNNVKLDSGVKRTVCKIKVVNPVQKSPVFIFFPLSSLY